MYLKKVLDKKHMQSKLCNLALLVPNYNISYMAMNWLVNSVNPNKILGAVKKLRS